jgi:hypothetical protein
MQYQINFYCVNINIFSHNNLVIVKIHTRIYSYTLPTACFSAMMPFLDMALNKWSQLQWSNEDELK